MVQVQETVSVLPPLILHPFADSHGPSKLAESSRAGLMLQGLLPRGDFTVDELERRVLEGRYSEFSMLFYIGRDLARWLEQCGEVLARQPDLAPPGVSVPSFAQMLVDSPPDAVREKLKKWGVVDHRSIFMRALGLNALFQELPALATLNPDFVKTYYVFAEQAFQTRQQITPFNKAETDQFVFEIYASGEYSRMLEKSWETD